MTKISALTPLGDGLAVGDQFIIRDIDDAGTPNKSVTISGITRGLDRGTNTAPAIAFAADKNTGIYSPGEDQLAVATNGTGKLFIDSIGNIGVGAASPSAWSYAGNITIPGAGRYLASTSDDIRFASNVYSSDVDRYVANGFATRYRMADGTHQWTTAVTGVAGNAITYNESMRITAGGLVGIGTSSPASALDVSGGSIKLRNASSGTNYGYEVNVNHVSGVSQKMLTARYMIENGSGSYIDIAGINAEIENAGFNSYGMSFRTGGSLTERVRIDGSGRVGIGTTGPARQLDVNKTAIFDSNGDGTTTSPSLAIGSSGVGFSYIGSQQLAFITNSTEKVRLDSSGRLLVGTSSTSGENCTLQVRNNSALAAEFFTSSDDTAGPYIHLTKSRGTAASPTEVSSGDTLGAIAFFGYDGSTYRTAARIVAEADGTWTDGGDTTDNPGRLVFSTTADGAASPTERMRISANGTVTITVGGAEPIVFGGTNATSIFRSGANGSGIHFTTNATIPTDETGALSDNTESFGTGTYRWSTIYAATGSINTSDLTTKQDVENLNLTELNVAIAIKSLIKKYRFKDAVIKKGSDARIHVGVIAQEVEQAFVAEGLDPRHYGMFCEDELEDGSKRLGIRYDELLAFVIAAL